MAGKPKQWWLRVHLSTCVILMFVAGGLIWLNMKPDVQALPFGGKGELVVWGWPFAA
jgi:hypothetical protein